MNAAGDRVDVLMFVEDPGAANYVAPLPRMLHLIDGIHTSVLAREPAASQLRSLGAKFLTVGDDAHAEAVISEQHPNLVMVGTSENPDSLGLALIDLSKEKRIPTIGVVDSRANVEHRFGGGTDNPHAHAPDIVIVPDEQTRHAFLSLGFHEEKVVSCGHPHYDHVRDERRRLEEVGAEQLRRSHGFAPAKNQTIIVFCAEISAGLKPQQFLRSAEYTLSGDARHSQRTEIVLDEFLAGFNAQKEKPYLVLRLHPKNDREDFAEFLSNFDLISEGGSSLEVVFCGDLIVGMTSVILTEAALLGRATVSIVPRLSERDWLPTIAMGITKTCTTSKEILEVFSDELEAHQPDATALDLGLPKDSTERVCRLIASVLDQGILDHEPRFSLDANRLNSQ